MNQYKLTFASACFGMLLFGISLITLGAVSSDLQTKFQLDAVESGTLFSILPIGIILGSLLFGPVSDRYGYKFFFVVSCLCLLVGFQGIAWSGSMGLLRFCIFLFGFGGGAINGATNAVVADISDSGSKGANLSLLGVFFGIGALGMPSVLAALERQFAFEQVVAAIGVLPVAAAVLFLFTPFPPPKRNQAVDANAIFSLLKVDFLWLIGFFLFCQSAVEGVVNNWTRTYLESHFGFTGSGALFTLSLYVAGLTVMRLALGSVLRNMSPSRIMALSLALLFTGALILRMTDTPAFATIALIVSGAGLAAGFPVMLGFAGARFAELSATAFSIILTVALAGNMIINYVTGVIIDRFGTDEYTTIILVIYVAMVPLTYFILRKHQKEIT
ncbi:MAG TPA: MFS transporter [Cyclobacteriaceae bacterium]|nr:MFS transporter [Cyclobacteriaceae bacterium]